ncbi:MAG TPA: hypothetical protein VGD95_00280 [Micavibrio sp.]
MTLSPETLLAAHQSACQYPHTSADMYQRAALIRIDSGEIVTDDTTHRTLIHTAPLSLALPQTTQLLPTYNLTLPGKPRSENSSENSLENRLAIIGIGANSAPSVLIEKFQKAGIGGTVYLAQATLEKHAVTHSAFIGAHAYMPATILPHAQSQTLITIGFYTPQQAAALTATEPHYDLVHKTGPIPTRALDAPATLAHGALLYVSIWGGFTDNGTDPVRQAAIPQTSPLPAQSTLWAAARAAHITGYGHDLCAFIQAIKPGAAHLQTRLEHSFKLHPHHAVPATIAGQQIKPAALYKQADKIAGLPMLPRIKYL